MGLFSRKSDADAEFKKSIELIADFIENQFNTKVYQHGVVKKGTPEFNKLIPFGVVAPSDAIYIGFFLIPLDDEDNIITHDYYDKYQKVSSVNPNLLSSMFVADDFRKILKSDWDLTNVLQQMLQTTVYDTGSMRVEEYKRNDNIVNNIEKIDDVRYRFFRFFA